MRKQPRATSLFPQLGFGLGLRTPHLKEVLQGHSSAQWFEVIAENYMGEGGTLRRGLEQVRRDHPVFFHGVSLSIGSTDPLCRDYLKKLKSMIARFDPAVVSDHLCWTGVNGENLHDLMPLPYTEKAIRHVVSRIERVQEALGRRILIENVSSYLNYRSSEMEEWEFLSEIALRADCGILLDINNIYVSSVNHGFDAKAYLDALPAHRVGQMHLAGHSTRELPDGRSFLIDTHDEPVRAEVWELYRHACESVGAINTMIERDGNIPALAELENELNQARRIALGPNEPARAARANAQSCHPA